MMLKDLSLDKTYMEDMSKINWILDNDSVMERIITCVNAMQGIEDPYSFVSEKFGEKTLKDKEHEECMTFAEECKTIISIFCHIHGYKNTKEMTEGLESYIKSMND